MSNLGFVSVEGVVTSVEPSIQGALRNSLDGLLALKVPVVVLRAKLVELVLYPLARRCRERRFVLQQVLCVLGEDLTDLPRATSHFSNDEHRRLLGLLHGTILTEEICVVDDSAKDVESEDGLVATYHLNHLT